MTDYMRNHDHLVLFDGVCNLCNGFVIFIIKHDRNGKIKFAPLQSSVGQEYINNDPEKTDSVVYITGNRHYYKSEAVLRILKDMGGIWKLFYGFKVLPAFLRDHLYDLIARHRYRIFGKKDNCMVPSPELKGRFIN
jgi:predicted DCC family thiol-disulfide oxidoreductase YuxK